MYNKNTAFKTLSEIEPYATIGNLQSYTATTEYTSIMQSRKNIKKLLELELIKDITPKTYTARPIYEKFYALTKAGYDAMGEEYKNIGCKNPDMRLLFHEVEKIDVKIAFQRNFKEVRYYYPPNKTKFNGTDKAVNPDIILQIGKYDFMVEIEKSREVGQIVRDKIKPYYTVDFSKYGFSKKTKLIIVVSKSGLGTPIRANRATDKEKKEIDGKMEELISRSKKYGDMFLYLPFYEFPNIGKAVFRNWKNEKVKLINSPLK